MKLITIQVDDQEHKAIKLAATERGLTIKEYLLGDNYTKTPEDVPKAIERGTQPPKVAKAAWCKQHDMEKAYCEGFKHAK